MEQIHSVPARPAPDACLSAPGRADPRLAGHVAGYAGFRSGTGAPLAHRLLPFTAAVVVIPFDGRPALVTGPRATATVDGPTTWGYGVTAGLFPAGATALLGTPAGALAGATVELRDLVGPARADGLAARLAAAPAWAERFALLDTVLLGWLDADRHGSPVVAESWRRLQRRDASRLTVAALAGDLGVSRRYLELGFRREVGLSPATVARVARFQAALGLLVRGTDLAGAAHRAGYADQPHFTREARAMAGVTPAELCAFVQYRPLVAP